MKPKGLKATAIIMSVFNIAAYLFINYKSQHLVFMLTFCTALVLLTYAILWFYWCGKNWARMLVILSSLVSLFNICKIQNHNSIQATIIVAEAVIGLYLLWWLNTSEVKEYFKGLKKDT